MKNCIFIFLICCSFLISCNTVERAFRREYDTHIEKVIDEKIATVEFTNCIAKIVRNEVNEIIDDHLTNLLKKVMEKFGPWIATLIVTAITGKLVLDKRKILKANNNNK